jgi:hypothetical protein
MVALTLHVRSRLLRSRLVTLVRGWLQRDSVSSAGFVCLFEMIGDNQIGCHVDGSHVTVLVTRGPTVPRHQVLVASFLFLFSSTISSLLLPSLLHAQAAYSLLSTNETVRNDLVFSVLSSLAKPCRNFDSPL